MARGWLLGEKPCRACRLHLHTLLPQRASSQTHSLLCETASRWKGGSPLALLAITDLQFFLLEEQGLSTEFTLNRAEGVSLLCERKIHASF